MINKSTKYKTVFGIWSSGSCVPLTHPTSNDASLKFNITAVYATQVLCILSAAATLTAVIIFIVHLLTKRLSLIASGIMFIFSAIFIMAALATWTQLVKPKIDGNVMHYGWAFGIGWCCLPLLLLLTFLVLCVPSMGIKYDTLTQEN